MNRIIQSVERLRDVSGARIDQGLLQVSSEPLHSELKKDMEELRAWIEPGHLPEDYTFFLEYYGGLSLSDATHAFQIRGVGPERNGWYFHLIGTPGEFDEGMYTNGFLEIALLNIRQGSSKGLYLFFLDIGGYIQKGSIICINEEKLISSAISVEKILQHLYNNPQLWLKVADTFTEWLEIVAEKAFGNSEPT